MNAATALLLHGCAGAALTLLSTFVGARSITVVDPEIMGCEHGCNVVATGWPLTFVSDYLGMSVVNTADITEVWFAADRFDWRMFLINAAVWTLASLAAHAGLLWWRAARR
ncbi:hypothetical protein [Brevundimonas sp. DWR2-3-1b1]|uniref:hypothetical protein n=1 Tax=unclassified Brevundimonas TaxID=2622653 RepID=UPI003CE79E1C